MLNSGVHGDFSIQVREHFFELFRVCYFVVQPQPTILVYILLYCIKYVLNFWVLKNTEKHWTKSSLQKTLELSEQMPKLI